MRLHQRSRSSVSLFVAASLWLASGRSRADVSTDQCIASNEKAQWLRQAGKFTEARAELVLCTDAHCPGMVRDNCVERLDELGRAQPTIVFDAKDPAGNDLSAVAVTVDGRPLVDHLDGTAIAVDAGDHTFVFTTAGKPSATRTFLLKEGEKARREIIVLSPAAQGPQVAPPLLATGATAAARPASGDSRALAYGAFGLGGAGIVVGAVLGVITLNTKSKLDALCGPSKRTCPTSSQSDIDAIQTTSTISTVGFIVGIVGLALGTVIAAWPRPPADSHTGTPEARRLTPWFGVGAGGLTGTFE
jgi:hypothetical protein